MTATRLTIASCLGAYLGELLDKLYTLRNSEEAPSSFVFLQACGTVLSDEDRRPFNGEEQGECSEFLEKLLGRLEFEELKARPTDRKEPSLVRKLFGIEFGHKVSVDDRYCRSTLTSIQTTCHTCGYTADSIITDTFRVQVEIPKNRDKVCLTDCLKTYSDPLSVEWRCDNCGTTGPATKSQFLEAAAPYAFIDINRVIAVSATEGIKDVTFVMTPKSNQLVLETDQEIGPYELVADMTHHGPR